MEKGKCGFCGWVYHPATGDPDNGIVPGTAFENLPANWYCPKCWTEKEYFTPITVKKCDSVHSQIFYDNYFNSHRDSSLPDISALAGAEDLIAKYITAICVLIEANSSTVPSKQSRNSRYSSLLEIGRVIGMDNLSKALLSISEKDCPPFSDPFLSQVVPPT